MRRSTDFAQTVRDGRRVVRSSLVVHLSLPLGLDDPALAGFVVPRSVGTAVVRNTVKRRLRYALRTRWSDLPAGSRLVVRATPRAATATYADLAADLSGALSGALAQVAHR